MCEVSYIYLGIVDKMLSLLKMVENVWAEINGARIIVLYKHLMKIYKVAYNLAKEYFLTAFA